LALVVALALAICPAAASAGPHVPIRLRLGVYPLEGEAGVCVVRAPARVRRCTLTQADPRVEHYAGFRQFPQVPGHIVHFRVNPGTPSPDTTSVEVRLRLLGGPLGPGGPLGAWHKLDLHRRGAQVFAADLPFEPGDQVALDVLVHGDGLGEAAAPLGVLEEAPRWGVAEWSPFLAAVGRDPHVHAGAYLSLEAVDERDDQEAPHLHVTYARHQDFLRTRRVYVDVSSDEAATLETKGLVLLPAGGPYDLWGYVYGPRPRLRPGIVRRISFEVSPDAVHAANLELRRGKSAYFVFRLRAFDRAGNERKTRRKRVLLPRR
jgi:hypothetical protein